MHAVCQPERDTVEIFRGYKIPNRKRFGMREEGALCDLSIHRVVVRGSERTVTRPIGTLSKRSRKESDRRERTRESQVRERNENDLHKRHESLLHLHINYLS